MTKSIDKMEAAKIAILYSTTDGHTLKICKRIIELLRVDGIQVEIFELSEFDSRLTDYDLVLIGASIRYGKHHQSVTTFIHDHQEALQLVKSAFFSVNLVARKPEKATATSNPYVVKFFQSIQWKPELIGVFAGVLNYPAYGFLDRLMIKLIMKITGGPTTGEGPIEYTRWERVEVFARQLVRIAKGEKELA